MRKIMLIAIITSTLLVGTVAAMPIISTLHRTFESMLAGTLAVTGSIVATDGGFFVTYTDYTGNQGSLANPGAFPTTPGGTSLGAFTSPESAGDWILLIDLATTASTPANTLFAVELRMVANGLFTTQTLYMQTGPTVPPSQHTLAEFDRGATLNTPLAYTLTIKIV